MTYVFPVELTAKKIGSIRSKLARQNSIFAEKRYLDSLCLPVNIIGRKEQAEQLLKHIESLKMGFVVPHVSVYGRSGSGKSTVVKIVCQNIKDLVSFAFVNLRKAKTSFGCVNLILDELGSEPLKSAEGINKAVDKIREQIEDTLISENKKFFVLVLDEYDVIFSDKRNSPSDFMYKLLIIEESLREKNLWLCIITISNNALSEYEFDDRVKSRMGNAEIYFAPYKKDDILEILRKRATKAFFKIDNSILEYCAEISSLENGDARRALDLLRVGGELCEGETISKSDIDKAKEQLQKDKLDLIIKNASYHLRLVIGAISVNHLYSCGDWTATSEIYDQYSNLINVKESKPLSYRRVSDLLVELQDTGLVISRTLSRGRHGFGTEYRLKFSHEIIGWELDKDWWWSIKDEKERYHQLEEKCEKEWKERAKMFKRGY